MFPGGLGKDLLFLYISVRHPIISYWFPLITDRVGYTAEASKAVILARHRKQFWDKRQL